MLVSPRNRAHSIQRTVLAATLTGLMAVHAVTSLAAADPVVLTFATVGDSRQDPVKADPTMLPLSGQDAKWLQNTKAWSRIMRTIQSQKANVLFFNGDMIMGYGKAAVPAASGYQNSAGLWSTPPTTAEVVGSDLMKFYQQYAFWRGMVAPLMETGTYVVPVPGNHEVQCSGQPSPATVGSSPSATNCEGVNGKKAVQANEDAWRDNMGDLIFDTSRWLSLVGAPMTPWNNTWTSPKYPQIGSDGITTNQEQLSFSFDYGSSHFAVVNTDPAGKDNFAPVNWLSQDLQAAHNRGQTRFFVFGHKPAFPYIYKAGVSPGGMDATNANAFWDVIETYHATYFSGHEHIYNISQPKLQAGGSAYQVIVGSGGSPFDAAKTDATYNPATDRSYAWAIVKVYQSGKVTLDAYGFNDSFGPTTVIQSITLHP